MKQTSFPALAIIMVFYGGPLAWADTANDAERSDQTEAVTVSPPLELTQVEKCALVRAEATSQPVVSGSGQGTLTVTVTNFRSGQGRLLLALHNSRASFAPNNCPDDVYMKQNLAVIDPVKMQAVFANIPFGEYGVSGFHDENNDGLLNRQGMMPLEFHGFSNDARGMMGPPDWEDTKFNFSSDGQEIVVNFRQM